MSIKASPALNNLLFVLIGERMLQADEDLAYASRRPYHRLADRLTDLSTDIERSVVGISRALPPQVGAHYLQSMKLFIDNGGTNHLRDFSDQLKTIGDGRTETSMNITESKWQIIAELVRLLIELMVIFVMSIFSGGASASQAAVAKARSRVVLLTVLDTLLKRTHLMPSLSQAFQEAFQTFAVRLAMMAAGPEGRRPKGFDWKAIAQDALIGAIAGLSHSVLSSGFDKFLKSIKGPTKNFTSDVASKTPQPSRFPVNNLGSTSLNDAKDFLVAGGSETLAEFLGVGIATGNWTTSWDTFLGAGISSKAESTLSHAASKPGTWAQKNFADVKVNTSSRDNASDGSRNGSEDTTGTHTDTGTPSANTGSTADTFTHTGPTGPKASTTSDRRNDLVTDPDDGNQSPGRTTNSSAPTPANLSTSSHPPTSSTHRSPDPDRLDGSGPEEESESEHVSSPVQQPGPATKPVVGHGTEENANGNRPAGAGHDNTNNTHSTENSHDTDDTEPSTGVLTESGNTPAASPYQAPVQSSPTPEHEVWKQFFDSSSDGPDQDFDSLTDEQQALLDRIGEERGTAPPTIDEVNLRRDVIARLRELEEGVVIYVDDAANFGHQAAATMLMDSLNALGHTGPITAIATQGVQKRLELLLNEDLGQRVQWLTGTFDPSSDVQDPPFPSQSAGSGPRTGDRRLVIVAASDRLTGEPDDARRFLDYMDTDRAVVLKPYAWETSHRLLYTRENPTATVTVTDLEHDESDHTGESASGRTIPDQSLFNFHTPLLTGDELNLLIDRHDDITPGRAAGLKAVAGAVHDGTIDLMPVYGLHNVVPQSRVSAINSLAQGIHDAQLGKPSVILTFGTVTLDGAKKYEPEWLHTASLGDENLSETLDALGPDEVLVVDGDKLPQEVFRQIFRLGGLPAVVEGANTSNLMQLLGRRYISSVTRHTPYDTLDPEQADRLQKVTDAVTHETEWGTELEFSDGWPRVERTETALSVLKALPASGDGSGGLRLSQDEMARLLARDGGTMHTGRERRYDVLDPAQVTAVLGTADEVKAMLDYETAGDRTAVPPSPVTVTPAQVGQLQALIRARREQHLDSVRQELAEYSVVPDAARTAVITDAIKDMRTEGTALNRYYQDLRAKARDPYNDQTLQALRLVLTGRGPLPAPVPPQRTVAPPPVATVSRQTLPAPLTPAPPVRSTPPAPAQQRPQVASTATVQVAEPTAVESDSDSDSDDGFGNFHTLLDDGSTPSDDDLDGEVVGSLFDSDAAPGPDAETTTPPNAPNQPAVVTRPVSSVIGLDDSVVADSDLVRQLLVDAESRQVGYASHSDTDWQQRANRFPTVVSADSYRDHHRNRSAVLRGRHTVPWKGQKVSFFAAHGTPTRVTLTRADGTKVQITGRELGRYLLRTQELGPENRPIVLYSCSTGGSPTHGGLSAAQHVANLTGRVVYAPTTESGTALVNGRVEPILHLDEEGTPGAWAAHHPEPTGATLHGIAVAAGLHEGTQPLDPWTATRTLQLVRTLRGTFGIEVEQSPRYGGLLRSLAELDSSRFGEDPFWAPYRDGRMTPELLRRISGDVAAAVETADAERTPEATGPGTSRTAEPPVPQMRSSLAGVKERYAGLLSLELSSPVTDDTPAGPVPDAAPDSDIEPAPAETASSQPLVEPPLPFMDELDLHRPVRVDPEMPAPPPAGSRVVFEDGSELPTYLTGDGEDPESGSTYGQSKVTLRGVEPVVGEIAGRSELRLPPERSEQDHPLTALEKALRLTPHTFHGDGWISPSFTDADGQKRVLRVVQRPHNAWERFADLHGDPVKVDQIHRSQITSGGSKSVSTARQLAVSLPIGPPGSVVAAYGRAGAAFGTQRTYDYGMQAQTLSQVETRMTDGSHLYLDDVQYEVWTENATGESTPSLTFGVRNGLLVRISDSLTTQSTSLHAPPTMTLDASTDYRTVHTEGFGPVQNILDWAVDRAKARPGSSAHAELTRFFSSENFHRVADRLAQGRVTGQPLFKDDKSATPMGAFVVDQVVPGEAVLLSETTLAELRNTLQQVIKNDRSLSRTTSQEIQAILGPSFNIASFFGPPAGLRAMAGLFGRYGRSATRTAVFGGSGSRKTVGRAKKVPTDLYLVKKTVHVRMTGDAASRPFTTWSLDRMTRAEARRLAKWDDGSALRRNADEPLAPAYLTARDPALLGMSRAEAFLYAHELAGDPENRAAPVPDRNFLDAFTDRTIEAVASAYPGMVAPLEHFGDPKDSRWRGNTHYRIALQNTLALVNALTHHSMAGQLETLVTTGIPVAMTDPSRLTRAKRWIWIDGELSERQYLGTRNELILRTSASGSERLDGSENVVRTKETGFDASLAVRDSVKDAGGTPINTGTAQAGFRWTWQKGRRTGSGATASYESLHASAAPSHMFGYQLTLSVKSGGYRRFRGALRGIATLGILGSGPFVMTEKHRDLIGGTAGQPVVGQVLLDVPDEHSSPLDRTEARPESPEITPLPERQTLALLNGDPDGLSEGYDIGFFGNLPYQVISVGGHRELTETVRELMAGVTGDSWHFTQAGSPAHDAMIRQFQSQYLTSSFDQTSGKNGARMVGLFGSGPYLNRVAELVHRAQVRNPVVISESVSIETEQTIGSDIQVSHTVVTTRVFTVGGIFSLTRSHPVGPGLAGGYGLQARWARARAQAHTVNRTATAEIDRDDESRKFLVSADTVHEIAVASHPDGYLAPLNRLAHPTRLSERGKRLMFGSDWLGHVPEKAAYRQKLVDDGLGDVPLYTQSPWHLPTWLRRHPFGSYPVNSLDPGPALSAFERELRKARIDTASRDRIRSLVTPRALQALRQQMASPSGLSARGRTHRLSLGPVRIGSRDAVLRVELIPGEPVFDGLDHSATFQDNLAAAETIEVSRTKGTSKTIGIQVSEGIQTGDDKAKAVTPSYGESGTSSQQTAVTTSITRLQGFTFYPNEPYADFLTPYRIRFVLDFDGKGGKSDENDKKTDSISEEADAGILREQVPLSLSAPGTQLKGTPGLLDVPDLAEPHPEVTFWPSGTVTPEAVIAWQSTKQPDGTVRPFTLPPNGFHVRRVTNLSTVRQAADLAIAKAQGTTLPKATVYTGGALAEAVKKAREAGLVHPGTASFQAVSDGLQPTQLAAFFGSSTEADGYVVAGLSENTFIGGANGSYRMYSKPLFGRATLLTVAPESTMESPVRYTEGSDTTVTLGGTQSSTLGIQPNLATPAAGATGPAITGTGPQTGEATGSKAGDAAGTQFNVKPKTGRSFLFSIPTEWLGVAEVERSFKDSSASTRVGKALGPFGYTAPGPQAVAFETHVLAWVREDVARQYGLIGDDTFPQQVADAWAAVTDSTAAWVDADKKYWAARRAVEELRSETDLRADVDRLRQEQRTAAERVRSLVDPDTGRPATTADPTAYERAVEELDALDTELEAAEQALRNRPEEAAERARQLAALAELLTAANAAASEFHRIRTAADRLTRWHRLPSERRVGLAAPPAVTYEAPAVPEQAGRPTYRVTTFDETPGTDLGPATLVSPDGENYVLNDVPEDGDAFYHALAESLHHIDPAALSGQVPVTDRASLVTELRTLMAATLQHPDNQQLSVFTTPDLPDTFTKEELDSGGPQFTADSPEAREFEKLGRIPLYAALPDAQERMALAIAQLTRTGSAPDGAGWNHGAADLLPALAARAFAVRVTVVREDGSFQEFAPSGEGTGSTAPHIVLYLKDGHYQWASLDGIPPAGDGDPLPAPVVPVTTTPAAPPASVPQPQRSWTTPPWKRGTTEGAVEQDGNGYTIDARAMTLTDPTGAVHDLLTPARSDSATGHGFWSALARALPPSPTGTAAALLAKQPLPGSAVLDPNARFQPEELTAVGLTPTDSTATATPEQKAALIRRHLLSARRWNDATVRTAAELAATGRGITIVVVNEDGTSHTYAPQGDSATVERRGPVVTLFRRGPDFLAARPRPSADSGEEPTTEVISEGDNGGPSTPDPLGSFLDEHGLRDIEVGSKDVARLGKDGQTLIRGNVSVKATFDLGAKVKISELNGTDKQVGNLLQRNAELLQDRPEVLARLKSLTSGKQRAKADQTATVPAAPRPPLPTMVWMPGYATGDQFGIAAMLIGDPQRHVLIITGPEPGADGHDPRDKGPAIRRFFIESGISPDRIELFRTESVKGDKKTAQRRFQEKFPAGSGLTNRKLDDHVIPVGSGTTWIGENFDSSVRDRIRAAWNLDDAHFSETDREAVDAWLRERGVEVTDDRDTIVLWSRFSGKKGDIHSEHDTSYRGMTQLLTHIQERAAQEGKRPLVIIAGDAYADPGHRRKYPESVERMREQGLDVHNLTHFWEEESGSHAEWGGGTRIGQMRLYEFLHRGSASLKHVGFRSGNLEALAFSGHDVRYLEEPGSIGSARMEKLHDANSKRVRPNSVSIGYERITVTVPPTRTGKFLVANRKLKQSGVELDWNVERPPFVFGSPGPRTEKPQALKNLEKGFMDEDLEKIMNYLFGAS